MEDSGEPIPDVSLAFREPLLYFPPPPEPGTSQFPGRIRNRLEKWVTETSFKSNLLNFNFHISCSMQLTNNSDLHVAFKVKATNPRKYRVRPNTGVVEPHSACDVIVTIQAQKEAPPDMHCRDKFLLQCVVAGAGIAAKDIAPEMFDKESGNQVEECKLKVSYIPPPLGPSSPVREGSEEESSPRVSVSDNGTVNQISESKLKSKTNVEPQESTSEGKALISKLA